MAGAYYFTFNTPTQEQGRAGCYWSRTARPGFFLNRYLKRAGTRHGFQPLHNSLEHPSDAEAQACPHIAIGIARDVQALSGRRIQQDVAFICDVAHDEGQPPIVIGVRIADARVPQAIAVDRPALAQVGELTPDMIVGGADIDLRIGTENVERRFVGRPDIPAPFR
jgi:hypothetical protein